jgi:predicted nucleotidyltransferase component of viral defense system
VRYGDSGAFRQALEQRLKTRAGEDGARLARDRKRVAFDRLLARLAAVAPERWLLKGGFALDLRLAERARATKDVDLDWQAGHTELLDTLLEAAEWDAADFFSFNIERTGPPQDRLAGSDRFRVTATLAGRPFETFLLDIGFRGRPIVGVETLKTPDLLSFADIEPVTVRVIALELQIAEKLHAYTRADEDKRPSTRTKDLVDLSLIAELSTLDAARLRQAIDATFANRATDQLPRSLPAPPEEWRTPFRALAQAVGVADDLGAGHTTAAALLDPVLSDKIKRGRWNPDDQEWAAEDQ